MLEKAGGLGREVENGRSSSPPGAMTEAGFRIGTASKRFNVHADGFATNLIHLDHCRQGSEEDHDGIGRELLRFIWAIGIKAEAAACRQQMAA
jgi:hypothetical protein